MKMTWKQAKLEVAALGCKLSATGFGGEYKLTFPGGETYFTDNANDAVGTARLQTKRDHVIVQAAR